MNLDLTLAAPPTTPVDSVLVETPDEDIFNFRCDNSTLEKFQSCQREGQFYVWERRCGAPTAALNLGSAMHEAWELLYLYGFSNETLSLCLQRIVDHYTVHPLSDDWRTCEFALNAFGAYYRQYSAHENLVPVNHNGHLFVENAFEILLGSINVDGFIDCPIRGRTYVKRLNIYWIGKIDIAVNFMDQLLVVDHKTTSRLGNTFWDKFQLSGQMLGYAWALQQIFGEPCAGVIVNVAAFRKPTKTGTSCEFHRQPYYYQPDAIDEWKVDTLTSISDFIASSVRGTFPPSKCNCIRVWGKCGYFDVCCLPRKNRKALLKSSEFSDVTWDPTKEQN
jgi:hypothetical protein